MESINGQESVKDLIDMVKSKWLSISKNYIDIYDLF